MIRFVLKKKLTSRQATRTWGYNLINSSEVSYLNLACFFASRFSMMILRLRMTLMISRSRSLSRSLSRNHFKTFFPLINDGLRRVRPSQKVTIPEEFVHERQRFIFFSSSLPLFSVWLSSSRFLSWFFVPLSCMPRSCYSFIPLTTSSNHEDRFVIVTVTRATTTTATE